MLRHERGHNTQAMMMGIGTFAVTVGIPSVFKLGLCSDEKTYYDAPWETLADVLGGREDKTHSSMEIDRAWSYYYKSHFFLPTIPYWS